jgi:hypothetical protein
MLTDDLKARILETARREPSPTARATTARRWNAALAAAAISTIVFFAAGGARVAPRPVALVLATAAGSAALALAMLWIGLGRGRSMLGRPRAVLWAASAIAPLVLLAWKLGWSARDAQMIAPWPSRLGFRCLALALAMGAAPLIAFAFARRSSDPVHPRAAGVALGVASGACSWVLVDLWCPIAYPPHLIVGHLLPIVLLALGGAWLGRRLLPPRA